MIINGMIKLLGEPVDGVPSDYGLSWQVDAGPYKATIIEWLFEGKEYYRYELSASGVRILSSTDNRSTPTIYEAIQLIEDSLRDYLMKKAIIERRFGPGSNYPNTILEYKVREGKRSSE